MKLDTKKGLAARTLGVGKERIIFQKSRLEEIKEALTKRDIRDLKKDGAIVIKDIKGRKKVVRRKRRGAGKIKKKVSNRKQEYVIMTRKLRAYVKNLKEKGELSKDETREIRNKIRNRFFRSKAHLKDYIGGLKK
jgi:ribosomal protein L19E